MSLSILKPKALRPGSTIGIFTPSSPAYIWNKGLFDNGIRTLESLGFKVKLGSLAVRKANQGYRPDNGKARADEFMELIEDPTVDALMSTIGGMNSSSMIPFLDFQKIRDARKIICGFSDMTSLHLAILKFSGLRTIYSPSMMCWFGEWPNGIPESSEWFLQAAIKHQSGARAVHPPQQWSNHKRAWDVDDWKTLPRIWQKNDGWKILNPGTIEAPILALNINTMLSAAGTNYWPDLKGKLLLLEDMEAPLNRTERALQQLKFMNVFDEIAGLIIGKPEVYEQQGAPFGYDDLIQEMIGPRNYPIVSNFDCSHTVPMLSVPQMTPVRLSAIKNQDVRFEFLDGGIE
jgi:muramoyltetrapeptide carboxypeptidase LdcA involved in peptidoglycan recycling